MFFIATNGSSYETGKQTGRATALAIGSMLDYLTKGFRDWDLPRFNAVRAQHMAYTEKLCPELVEEIEGIADGAGFPFHLIYLMNFYAVMLAGNESCSNIILPETAKGPLLAKTNDLPVYEGHRSGVRLLKTSDDRPTLLGGTFPGTVWCAPGVNEWGLAVGGSSCSAQVTRPAEVLTPHVLARYVLSRAATVKEAVELLEPISIPPWGLNIPLVDRDGNAAIVEKAGSLQSVRWSRGEPIFCTNHSCTPEMSQYRIDNPAVLAESRARFAAIEQGITGEKPGTALLRTVVARTEQPGAVCRQGDLDPLGYETEYSCILYPASGKAEFCFSHADRDPWREFAIEGESAMLAGTAGQVVAAQ